MAMSAQDLAAILEEAIWAIPAEQLQPAEPMVVALAAAAGCFLPSVLGEMADETLARAVQHGLLRRLAFEEWLVNRYEAALRRWFCRRTGSWERALDLVQEIYVKLLTPKVLNSYNPDHPFCPWFWRVVQRFWIDELRRGHAPLQGLEVVQEGVGPNPAEEAVARELRVDLEAAVIELPLPQRRVFLLALEGSTAGQIAQALAIPKSKVYRLLFHARRALERALEEPAAR